MTDAPEPIRIPEVQVKANATVERLGEGWWRVEAWGQPPFDQRRVYELQAIDDNMAAFAGIDRFVNEMLAVASNSPRGS